MTVRIFLGATLLAACAAAAAGPAAMHDPIISNSQKRSLCGDLHTAFGPWDYRDGNIDNRVNIVLSVHFPPEVENNEHGARGTIGGDLSYTLVVLPNYIPALLSMARQAKKERTLQPLGARYPVECYFERAVRFRPKDAAVRTVYANWLREQGRDNDARVQYLAAVELTPNNAAANYNVGLLYFRAKDYEKANLYAHRAYALGFPLPTLREHLVQAGKWADVTDEQLGLPAEVVNGRKEEKPDAAAPATDPAAAAPSAGPSAAPSAPPPSAAPAAPAAPTSHQ